MQRNNNVAQTTKYYRLYSGEEEGQLYNYDEIKKDIQNRIMLV